MHLFVVDEDMLTQLRYLDEPPYYFFLSNIICSQFFWYIYICGSCREGNSYNNPYLVEQSLQCSSRDNENDQNVWFNFSSTYQQQQPNEQQQLSALYSSIQSPASYGVLPGISAGSNTNYYNNNLFSSSLRNNNNNNHNSSSTSTLDLLSSSSFSSTMGYNLHAVDRHHHLDFLSTPNYNSSAFNKNRALFGYAHQQQQHHHHHVQDSINNNNSPSNSSNKVCIFSSSYTHFFVFNLLSFIQSFYPFVDLG